MTWKELGEVAAVAVQRALPNLTVHLRKQIGRQVSEELRIELLKEGFVGSVEDDAEAFPGLFDK